MLDQVMYQDCDKITSGYSDGGTYGCISKNKALEQKIVSSKDTKTVEISQSVLTSFSPNRYLMFVV